MAIYFLFFFVSALFLYLSYRSRRGMRRAFDLMFFLSIWLFPGLRGFVGTDSLHYVEAFHYANTKDGVIGLFSTYEPLFVSYLWVLRTLTSSGFVFILVTAFVQAVLLFKIYRNTNRVFILSYILIFFLNFHFNALRAGIALLFFLIYLTEESKKTKLVCAIAAPLFHVSILIFYPFFVFRWKPIYAIASIVLLVVLATIFSGYIDIFVYKFTKYSDYLVNSVQGISWSQIITYLCLVPLLLTEGRPNKNRNFFIAIMLLVAVYAVYPFLPVFYRFIQICTVVVLLYAFIPQSKDYSKRQLMYALPLLGFLCLFGWYTIYQQPITVMTNVRSGTEPSIDLKSVYIPYRFYWDDGYLYPRSN